MKRKDYDDYEDAEIMNTNDAFPQKEPMMFGGIMPKFDDNYAPIDIVNTQNDIKNKSQELVNNICEIYYKLDESQDEATTRYLEGLKKVEVMNLENLLLQVKASEHMLYSLLGRLNATGSIDNGLYKLISETQQKSIELTLQVSQYVRSLPTYFKQLRFELSTNVEMVKVEQTQEMLELKQDTEKDDSDNFVKRPQKGMRGFLKQLEEAEKSMKEQNETIDDNINLPNQPSILEKSTNVNEIKDLREELLKDNE